MIMDARRPLEEEIEFFKENLDEWLQAYRGRVVLVKGHALVGVFDNENQALTAGARLYGAGPYLIRRVVKDQPVESNLALCLGMISAAPR